jgi:hypothetical protein
MTDTATSQEKIARLNSAAYSEWTFFPVHGTTRNAIYRNGITFRTLLRMTDEDLIVLPGFGEKTVADIRRAFTKLSQGSAE